MVKRKKADGSESDGDQVIPIPIQTFLWRQTSPFIRPKLGKLCEASCMSFERVIVQNILHGLSPSLCEAIQSVSRWRVIQASLPHVVHCCASMLASRHQTNPGAKFTSNEIKLLYTLHWILLDAASECEDAETEQAVGRTVLSYLHSLDAIQLFVFLLVPLVCTLKESDFQSLKLENGLRLWEPLLHYRQPDIPCFSTPVKAKRVLLKAQRNLLKVNFNMANIYIGKGSSTNDIYLGFDSPEQASEKPAENAEASSPSSTGSPVAPIAHMSDICALSTTDTNTSVDTTCDVCHEAMTSNNGALVCKCGQQRRVSTVSATSERSLLGSGVDKNFAAQRLESAISTFARSYANPDILSASYFDVAVLQCFFCPQWNEEGVYWGLRYIHQRLLEISSEVQNVEFQRERSRSLPTPEARVLQMDFGFPTPSTPTRKDSVSVEANVLANVTLPMRKDVVASEGRREPSFKRMRVFIGDKMKQLRHRDSVDQFDLESRGLMRDFALESSSSLDNLSADAGGGSGTRPDSALSRLTENDEDSQEDEDKESCDSSSDNNRRRTAASETQRHQSLIITEEDDDSSGSGGSKQVRGSAISVPRSSILRPEPCQKPIITITSDSPEPSNSPNSPRWPTRHRDSFTSVKLKPCVAEEIPTFQRSLTDSTINYYNGDEVEEVPGSTFYIQNNGQLNYHVILQGVHNISSRHPSARVCAVIFNVVNCFLDLNIIERVDRTTASNAPGTGRKGKSEKQPKSRKKSEKDVEPFGKVKENTTFAMAMETVLRVYKTLGCPHGCGEGVRGLEGDHLRSQGINCLTRLMKANPPQFKKFLQSKFLEQQPLQPLLDNLHALLGFCAELVTSPQGPGPRKSVAEPGHRTGYGNNFGEQPGGGGTVQGQLIVHLLKPLLTKFVESRKEILAHENIGLFCDIRQLLNYVKESHGGTFRRIALSGLMDALKPTDTREPESSKKVIRRTHSVTSESGDERECRTSSSEGSGMKPRQNLFRKKIKKADKNYKFFLFKNLRSSKSSDKIADKRALKIIRVQDAAIYVLTMTDQYIVTGDSHGHVRFFDQSLQLVNWYHDFHLGPVNAVSFAYSTDFVAGTVTGKKYPPDATIKALPFIVRDFVVGTTNAIYAHVSVDGTDVKVISRDFDAAVYALATHPTAIVIVSRIFDRGQSIRCCTFDPLGQILAVGFNSGFIRLVDALSLEDVSQQPLRFTHDAITHIAFSHDSQYLATADAGFAISVFKKTNNVGQPFTILGRYRSHYKTIKDLSFGIKLDSNGPRLLSLGEDRFLVEYDLENSSHDNLRILSSDRVEQSGIAQCMMWYPPITKESFILTANDQFKFKLYNSTTKMCRKTVLGPTYGSPIQKMVLIPTANEVLDKRYMAYAIRDKVGLVILPLDGNPHNSSAIIAHPRGVSNIAISNDGKYMFTSGGADASVHVWTINLRALEVQARLGGEDLIPFYGLLEGGREGPLFRELEDLFYYAQIRSQGVDAEETREITDTVAVSEIPFVMRALGYYPTEQEIEEMLNEVKFGNYVETGELTTKINLGDFIKLYVNHRPAFGLDINQLKWAFEVLGFKTNNTHAIDRDQLLDLLQNYGEHMTDQEMAEHLSTLVGFNPEGGSCEHEDIEIEAIDEILEKSFPETITAEMFAEELLGFQSCKSDELERKTTPASEPGRS